MLRPVASLAVILASLFVGGLSGTHTAYAAQVVVVILDDSGSMREPISTAHGQSNKMAAAKSALVSVINALPEDTIFGVTLLNGESGSIRPVPLGPLDRDEAIRKINFIEANGGTPLGDAMRNAADELLAYRKQHMYGLYKLLIITDGEATDPELVSTYLPMIVARGLAIDVIGVGMVREHQLASQTHSYRNVDDAESFTQAVSEILAEPNFDQDQNSDFELIAGIPDELAAEALKALAQVDNTPITRSADDASVSDSAQPTPTTGGTPDNTIEINSPFGFCCCCFPILLIIVVAIIANQAILAKKRQR